MTTILIIIAVGYFIVGGMFGLIFGLHYSDKVGHREYYRGLNQGRNEKH